ncbi:phytosulfokines 5-like [Chenopodium quinoa]|uniref:phytosulfokines 5-like n=1 Tax=Chenopodium quinoa TaxID=63459 RepID=UPI000B77E88F|nr:phytosulfokines 5-like [Chenopodium quinoa]XP_021746436.1 phytosulfokines 5-like [Chenopodium quinoa]
MKSFSLRFVVFVFVVLLALSYITSARVLLPKLEQGKQELEIKSNAAKIEDVSNLMGFDEIEVCRNKGEDCNAERKLLAEAHLDYIYTQKIDSP